MQHLRQAGRHRPQRALECVRQLGVVNHAQAAVLGCSSRAQSSWTDDPEPLSEQEAAVLLKRMVRSNALSELAAARLATGQRCLQRRRPDLQYREERERELLRKAEALVPQYRVRPSLLRPLAAALGLSLGAASSVLPTASAGAITGAVQEALTERFNDQLREMRAAGLSEFAGELREALLRLRDEPRAPPEAVQAPDLLKLQRPQELQPEEILAGVVKYGVKGLLDLGARI